jgi:hypothetical protein
LYVPPSSRIRKVGGFNNSESVFLLVGRQMRECAKVRQIVLLKMAKIDFEETRVRVVKRRLAF